MQSEYASKLNKLLFATNSLVPLLLMPAGFAAIAFFSTRYFNGTAGSGIPQTIAALNEPRAGKRRDLLSLHIAVGKVILTLASIAVGASVGREGPTVQIGASIMHFFYGHGPFRSPAHRRALILAGGAAGVAAAFNTPLAGIMFAIEELSKKHVFNANTPTIVTVVFSGLISLFLLGSYTYFGFTAATLDLATEGAAILVCGAAGGVAGAAFSRAMIAGTTLLPSRTDQKSRLLLIAALGGSAVAVIGLMTDGVIFGTGYEVTRAALEGREELPWYFGIAKLAATLLSTLSGIPGGIFAPSLAVGAGLGENVASFLPTIAPHSAVIVLTMAAYLAGVTREPMTSFVIMMEMTSSHHMLLPLMATTVVATGASRLVCPAPLYQTLADRFMGPAVDVAGLPDNAKNLQTK